MNVGSFVPYAVHASSTCSMAESRYSLEPWTKPPTASSRGLRYGRPAESPGFLLFLRLPRMPKTLRGFSAGMGEKASGAIEPISRAEIYRRIAHRRPIIAAIPSIGQTAQKVPLHVRALMPIMPSAVIASVTILRSKRAWSRFQARAAMTMSASSGKRAQKTPCHVRRLMPTSMAAMTPSTLNSLRP